MSWILDLVNPQERKWEEFYRNRWSHDSVIRSTHGVNCTGGCSWAIYVKDGIITWEMQQTDYPLLERSLPPYEPRGCQRGISAWQNRMVSLTRRIEGRGGNTNSFCAWYSLRMT